MSTLIVCSLRREARARRLLTALLACALAACGTDGVGPGGGAVSVGGVTLDEVLLRIKADATREELREWLAPCVGEEVEWSGRVNGTESERMPGEQSTAWLVVTLAEAMDDDDILARSVFAAVPMAQAEADRFQMGTPVRVRGTIGRVDTGPGSMKSSTACYFILLDGATVQR